MVSLRKRYSTSADKDEPPVRMSPVTLDVPAPAEERPSEGKTPLTNGADASPPVESNPVREAEKKAIALQLRLQEMERAEASREAANHTQPASEEPQQQVPPTAEQIIEGSGLPELAKTWLRQHPEYVSDPAKNARLRKMHNVAEWQSGQEYTAAYFDRMDILLGLKQEPRPAQSNGNATPQRAPQAAPARPRTAAPFSAPISREAPSMRTGKPMERQPQLTADELEIAQGSGISPEEYARQKARWEKMKHDGYQDGRNDRR
jgi:hypothetical protein